MRLFVHDNNTIRFPVVIAILGHALALFWYAAKKNNWKICERTIYDIPIKSRQIRRELVNSLHSPAHAIFIYLFVWLGCFKNTSVISIFGTLVLTFVWAEFWHYFSHRAMHIKMLHWIHAEHHRSHLNSPFTAISFSLSEKLVFDFGLLGVLCLIDLLLGLNFYGIALWYIGYLIINSFSHANFEFRPENFNQHVGKYLASTTYHSMHHSRYSGNYGLGTRFLDRLFETEWSDYEALYDKVSKDRKPLNSLREHVEVPD